MESSEDDNDSERLFSQAENLLASTHIHGR